MGRHTEFPNPFRTIRFHDLILPFVSLTDFSTFFFVIDKNEMKSMKSRSIELLPESTWTWHLMRCIHFPVNV